MKCVERLCKGIYGTKCRQLVGDNMCLVLTQCRWRSRLFALIVILRRAAAYILAGDMVIVSRWIMSARATHPADYRNSISHGDQVMHATGEQAHSGACLARACGCDASNQTKQRACSMSKRNTLPPAVPYSTSGHQDDGHAEGKQALSETSLDCKEALGTKPCTSGFFGKGTCAEFKHRPPATPQHENKTETVPRCQRTLSDEVA